MERAARADLALLERVAHLARPVALAQDQTVPVHDALGPLLPDVGLRRGQVVAVGGPAGTSLALLLAAAPSAAGAWVGVVGVPGLGLLAAAEMGVALERLVLVAAPEPAAWASVAATLVDAVDIVLLAPPRGLRTGDARRLQARVRERGAVVVHLTGGSSGASGSGSGASSSPFEADLVLTATAATWHGLAAGSGRLVARQVAVTASGRRAAARPRSAVLWLPDEQGRVRIDHEAAPVVALRTTGTG
jgi:hypothetical protein